MNAEVLFPVVTASLMGSLHCALMCGGLVAALPPGRGTAAAYHLGRLLGYVTLGALAGSAGTALDLAGEQAGLGRVAALISGGLVLTLGLIALLASQGVRLPTLALGGSVARRLGNAASRFDHPIKQASLLGVSTAFLPCGWLYAFVLAAAATSSPVAGGLVMSAFFVGTLPSLLGFGFLLPRLVAPVKRHLPLFSALLLVGLGLFTVVHRANLPALSLSMAGAAVAPGGAGPVPSPRCH